MVGFGVGPVILLSCKSKSVHNRNFITLMVSLLRMACLHCDGLNCAAYLAATIHVREGQLGYLAHSMPSQMIHAVGLPDSISDFYAIIVMLTRCTHYILCGVWCTH